MYESFCRKDTLFPKNERFVVEISVQLEIPNASFLQDEDGFRSLHSLDERRSRSEVWSERDCVAERGKNCTTYRLYTR
jgi:hypothetical protein